MADLYSMAWNEKDRCFYAKVRKPDGSGWHTKQIPRRYGRAAELDAERWLLGWIQTWQATYGRASVPSHAVTPVGTTVAFLAPKWLELRKKDPGTRPNTWRGHDQAVRLWILDSDEKHVSVQNARLDAGELTISLARSWIQSLRGSQSTRLAYVNSFRTLINDAIGEGWLSPDFVNPFELSAVRKVIGVLSKGRQEERVFTYLPDDQISLLLERECPKVDDFRRVRYTLAIATGMRRREVQGLMWRDVHLDAAIPHVFVQRQLDRAGPAPAARYEDLVLQNVTKDELDQWPTAVVANPKKNSRRKIPLHPLAVATLRYWRELGWRLRTGQQPTADDPVFPVGSVHASRTYGSRRKATPIDFTLPDESVFHLDLERLGMRTEMNGGAIVFHSLRHTFSMLMKGAGADDPTVSVALGHGASSTAAKHYLERELNDLAPFVAKLALPSKVVLKRRVVRVPDNNAQGDASAGVFSEAATHH